MKKIKARDFGVGRGRRKKAKPTGLAGLPERPDMAGWKEMEPLPELHEPELVPKDETSRDEWREVATKHIAAVKELRKRIEQLEAERNIALSQVEQYCEDAGRWMVGESRHRENAERLAAALKSKAHPGKNGVGGLVHSYNGGPEWGPAPDESCSMCEALRQHEELTRQENI